MCLRMFLVTALAACAALTSAPIALAAPAAPIPAKVALAPRTEPAPVNQHRKWAWTATGAALATASLGASMFVASRATSHELEDLRVIAGQGQAPLTGAARTRERELQAERKRQRLIGGACLGVAGAAAVTAAILFSHRPAPRTARLQVAPFLGEGQAGLAAWGRF